MRPLTPIALALALTTLASQGQISFGPSREIADFINYPRDTQAVDMDGDGDLDVISQEDPFVRVFWWENDGNGGFGKRHEWSWDKTDSALGLADYDGDGRPDVWINTSQWREEDDSHLQEIRVAVAGPDGVYGEPVIVASMDSKSDDARVADMDGDGRVDLVTERGIWLQKSDGTFAAPPQGTFAPGTEISDIDDEGNGSQQLAHYDFDGDGDLDLIFKNESYQPPALKIAVNLGGGLLAPPTVLFQPAVDERLRFFLLIPPAANEAGSRLVAIIGNDGGDDRLEIFDLSPLGVVSSVHSEERGDLGEDEIVWDSDHGRLIFFDYDFENMPDDLSRIPIEVRSLVLPDGGQAPEWSPLLSLDGSLSSPILADLNGDGVRDLLLPFTGLEGVVGPFAGQLQWVAGNSSGQLSEEVKPISQLAVAGRIAYVGDLDGDGDCDVLTADHGLMDRSSWGTPHAHKLVLWKNSGHGESFDHLLLSGDHYSMDVLDVRDRNMDGRPDILIQTFDPDPALTDFRGPLEITWLMQEGDGSFSPEVVLRRQSQDKLFGPKLVDWDGDEILDLVGSLRDSDRFSGQFAKGRADGTYQTFYICTPPRSSPVAGWDDLDHNGTPDCYWLFEEYWQPFTFWLRNDGSGEINVLPHVIMPLNQDIDGDGFDDFSSHEYPSENQAYYISRPDATFEAVPADLHHRSFVDLDDDGDLDQLHQEWQENWVPFEGFHWSENGDGRSFDAVGRVSAPRYGDNPNCAMGDLDGDGTKDLIVLTTSRSARFEWFKVTKRSAPPEFTSLMNQHGLKGNIGGPLSDGDGDGITNWEEFVFGSDPAAVDPTHSGRPRLEKQGNAWTYSYQRRIGLASPPKVQTSTDLEIWNDAAPAALSSQPAAPGYEWMSKESGGEDALFFRTVIPTP